MTLDRYVCACVHIISILFALYMQYVSQGKNLANTVSRALSITNEVDSVSCSIKHNYDIAQCTPSRTTTPPPHTYTQSP